VIVGRFPFYWRYVAALTDIFLTQKGLYALMALEQARSPGI